METFLQGLLGFFILEIILLIVLFIYVFFKTGKTIKGFKDYWKHSEGNKPMWKSVAVLLAMPLIFAIVLKSCNAEAEEIKWFDGASVFIGLDNTVSSSPMCKSEGINDRLTSNIGFTQNIIKRGALSVNGKYIHHSCAVNPDKQGYDSIGIEIKMDIY